MAGDGKKGGAEAKPAREWTPELQADFDRILSVGEECISADSLKKLLLAKGRGSENQHGINLYDGFEPSGRMHIAQGVFKAVNVNKCTAEGSNTTFIFWVADWFALMNDKMGGDLDKIKTVGLYLMEVWKAAGMNLSHVVFKWSSEEITNNADAYWPKMLDIARRFNITRIKKCCQIMGRLEGSLTAAQILYPIMQCTDVFFLRADICQLGVDQRKVNMLARDYCDAAKQKNKPVILSHHMLYGLKAGQEKMSKSDPDSAVFMEDSAEDVERKIMNAYCPTEPQKKTEDKAAAGDAGKESMHLTEDTLKNPCLDYIENIIFAPPGATFTIGDTTYTEYATVKEKFIAGDIPEEDLKRALIRELNVLLAPVRDHFTNDENAKNLLALVQKYKKEAMPKDKAIQRLNLVALNKVQAQSHVVFAPLPSSNQTLQDAVETLKLLHESNDKPCVLYLSDWSAIVRNACGSEPKHINASYSIFLSALKALDPAKMENVAILKQSEAILADPSNYWISVINVGRHFMLNDVMGSAMKDSDNAGIVVARLMQVADAAGLEASSIAMIEGDETTVMQDLITKFFDAKLTGVTKPEISVVQATSLVLQQRESEAHKQDNDEYFLLDDPKAHGKSKLKKAFCEPGNIGFCPPITLASTFFFDLAKSEMKISRSEADGGEIVFRTKAEIEAAFANESVHPGDLKAAVMGLMVETITKISTAIKAEPDLVKASKAMKTLHKNLMKRKKK